MDKNQVGSRRKIGIFVAVFLIVAFAGYFYLNQKTSEYDSFAKCLTSKGFSIGGTDTCPSCKSRKKLFGSSFRYVNYHRCDSDKLWCSRNGVYRYPTWVLPDGSTLVGVQDLKYLSSISDCELEE